MRKWMILPCIVLLAGMVAAQTSVPAGTAMMVKLETTLATFSNRVGDPFQGRLTQPIVLNGKTVIPTGAMSTKKASLRDQVTTAAINWKPAVARPAACSLAVLWVADLAF